MIGYENNPQPKEEPDHDRVAEIMRKELFAGQKIYLKVGLITKGYRLCDFIQSVADTDPVVSALELMCKDPSAESAKHADAVIREQVLAECYKDAQFYLEALRDE